jgi:hypothetical protein
MSAKKKLKRAYINVGYPRHADILSLTNRFGIQGKCASYDLILAMSDASNGIIDRDAFLYTCKLNEVKDPEAFLAYCTEKRIFIEVSGGYSNSIVLKDQENYAKVLDEDRERKRNKSGIRPESERKLDIDIDNDPDLNKIEIALPEFQTPKLSRAIERWRQHRRKAREILRPDGRRRAPEPLCGTASRPRRRHRPFNFKRLANLKREKQRDFQAA